MDETSHRTLIRISGEEYWLTAEDIVRVTSVESPRRINSYFVEIGGTRYPPKQLVRAATGTKQFFDTAAAVRILKSLGFFVHSGSNG
jgi:5-methylcytosine-specific restriction enzyme B